MLDTMLRRFLQEQEEDKRRGYTPKALRDAVDRIANTQLTHEQKDEERHTEVLTRIKGVEARVDSLEKNADSSGHHMREKLDSFNSDLDAVEQTVTSVKQAAETQLAALRAAFEGERQRAKDAEQAAKDAELAQFRAEKKERVTAARSIGGKIFVAVVTAVILSAGGGIVYLIQHAH